jgi:hypothetical protein
VAGSAFVPSTRWATLATLLIARMEGAVHLPKPESESRTLKRALYYIADAAHPM